MEFERFLQQMGEWELATIPDVGSFHRVVEYCTIFWDGG